MTGRSLCKRPSQRNGLFSLLDFVKEKKCQWKRGNGFSVRDLPSNIVLLPLQVQKLIFFSIRMCESAFQRFHNSISEKTNVPFKILIYVVKPQLFSKWNSECHPTLTLLWRMLIVHPKWEQWGRYTDQLVSVSHKSYIIYMQVSLGSYTRQGN